MRVTTASRAARLACVAGIVLVALLVSAVAVRAGFWQLGRHEARSAAIAASEANSGLPRVPVDQAAGPDGSVSADEEWRQVTVTGVVDQDSLTLLRNRPVDRERAYQLLVWIDTADGGSILVNAGWIPVPDADEDVRLPSLPDGEVTVTGVLRQAEPDDGRRDQGATRVTPAQMPAPAGVPLDGYVLLTDALAAPVPVPVLSLGPHLAYAWQWFAFAVIAPVGGVLLARREWRDGSGQGDDAARAARARPARPTRKRPRGPSDEEIEDAL